MHRLFWKIFLSFWIALVLFTVAIVLAASQYLEQVKAQRDASVRYETLNRQVAEAQAVLQSEGVEGLKAWARQVDGEEMVPVLVLNADGSEYWLTHDFQSVTLGRFLQRPRVVAMPLMVGVFIGALVCLLLARYLTAPIEQLRRATEAYAAGDLSQRVGPSLGNRRDEIVDLATAFDRMAERLSALIFSQKQLLRDVSHELRSPLSRLQVALGLARQRAGDRSGQRAVVAQRH